MLLINSKKRLSRNHAIVLVMLATCFLLALLYVGHNRMQKTALPQAYEQSEVRGLSTHFSDEFSIANVKLKRLGYAFTAAPTQRCSTIYNSSLEQADSSIRCEYRQTSETLTVDNTFTANWRSRELVLPHLLDVYLVSAGWKQDGGQQSIVKLFDMPQTGTVSYSHLRNAIQCHLLIHYDSGSATTYTTESCSMDFT